jgi:ABC-2 type transport system ATP-binding protein
VSAYEWVTYQVRLHGLSQQDSKQFAAESLQQVDMTEHMHRPMGEYSLGMRQRTKIAQAIAHRPDLLILDEPYNGLDPVGRYQMTELLVNFSKQGNGLLFASHVLHEIEEITSSFLLIHGGRLLASGTARDVEQIIADTPQEVVLFGPDVPRLIPHLADQSWVDSIQLLSERTELRIGLRDPTNLYQSLAGWISADHLQVDRFQTADSNLTAVFESLLRRHRGESK